MKNKIIVVFILFSYLGLNGQVTFKSYLESTNSDKKLSGAHTLWEYYLRNQPDSLRFLAADLFHFGEANNHESARVFSKRILGCYLVRRGDFKNGEKELKKSLIFHRKKGDKANETEDLNELGISSFLKGDYHSAQSFFQLSLQVGKELSDKKFGILAQLNLAKTYDKIDLKDRAEAVAKHYLKACQAMKKYESVSNAYGFLSDLALYAKKMDLAEEYLNKSLNASMLTNNKLFQAQVYANLGAFWAESSNYEKAAENFQKSLDIRKNINYIKGIIEAFINLAYLQYVQNNFQESQSIFLNALEIARKNQFYNDEVEILEMLVEIQKEMKNKDQEVKYLNEFLEAKSKQAEIVYQGKEENEELINYLQDENSSKNHKNTIVESNFWTGFFIGFSSLLAFLIIYHFFNLRYSHSENRNYDE
jgi:tetratricopeptide (TPR) repeat protein